MANHRQCEGHRKGNPSQHVERFQAPSNRTDLSKGSKPRRAEYSYRCPVIERLPVANLDLLTKVAQQAKV